MARRSLQQAMSETHFVPNLIADAVDHRLAVDVVVSSSELTPPRLDPPSATTIAIAKLDNGWTIRRFALSGPESDSRGDTSRETSTGVFFRAFLSLFGDQANEEPFERQFARGYAITQSFQRFSWTPPRGSRFFFKEYQGQLARRCGNTDNIQVSSS